jgi:hypothetical protein
MYNEIDWTDDGPALTLYNRIKPFSYQNSNNSAELSDLRSLFYYIKTHELDSVQIQSVNMGTNWRDKYNFIEIKPQFEDFKIREHEFLKKTQTADEEAFHREGFRPLIVGTKQVPLNDKFTIKWEAIEKWVKLMREWYFDTHRLLNGTVTMTGSTEYLAVGNNIRFEAGLVNPTPNINSATNKQKKNEYILAHIENISHSFSIREDGARQFITTIQFVRGIVVNKTDTNAYSLVGEGALDHMTDSLSSSDVNNTTNTVTSSADDDPDKPVRGR